MSDALERPRIYLELGPKKVFACSLDWPGWCRVGKSGQLALETLMASVPRYRVIAERAGLSFEPGDPVVVAEVAGSPVTDFGAPATVPAVDAEPLDSLAAQRMTALMGAAWSLFADVAAASPQELRKGPRGGGRDRDKIIAHVVEAERSYARKVGVRHRPFAFDDGAALAMMREEIANVLARPSDGAPLIEGGWPARYAARRIAWHVIDHAWEMQDRHTFP
jgi:hypothetical protein